MKFWFNPSSTWKASNYPLAIQQALFILLMRSCSVVGLKYWQYYLCFISSFTYQVLRNHYNLQSLALKQTPIVTASCLKVLSIGNRWLLFQLEDTRRLADAEARDRASLVGKFRNLESDLVTFLKLLSSFLNTFMLDKGFSHNLNQFPIATQGANDSI